jgi:carbonic anhydrase
MRAEIPRRGFLGLAAAAAAGSVVPWVTSSRPAQAQAPGAEMDPTVVLADLMAGNERYLAGGQQSRGVASDEEDFTWGQAPRAVILALGESAVPPEIIFDQAREDLFVMGLPESGVDEHGLASVEYATAVLGTRLVLVLGQGQGGPSVAAKSQLSHRLAKAQSSAAELAGSDPLIAKSVASGQVKVLAGVHDLATGKVEILD